MAMSGIELHEEIVPLYNEVKLKHSHKFIIFKIEGKKRIVVETRGDPRSTDSFDEDKESFEEMKSHLTNEPRYILYDFGFTNKESRKIQKLGFIFWCDDNAAKIGDKMLYASSKDTLKKVFTGLGAEFQANDHADMDYKSLHEEVEKKA